MLSRIRIVLVETSHPGNIGAVARAMKNMRMADLYLVDPKKFPSADATARASGADDILCNAKVCDTLAQSIAGCQIVIGCSARLRSLQWPVLSPRQCAHFLQTESQHNQVAIIFGRENSGLKNHELDLCQHLLKIPCNEDYSSLNLAAAVQVVCYELFVAAAEQPVKQTELEAPLANAEQMASFYRHLAQMLHDVGFLHPERSKSVLRRLRRIYNRARLDTKELDILRGIMRMSQNNNK